MAKSKRKYVFKIGENVVYKTHGVGQVVDIETQEIGGTKVELFVVYFTNDKMTLRVPIERAREIGMRLVADTKMLDKVFETLKARAKVKRIMWSRRAQEYEQKINSGDIIAVAEVVRDLNHGIDQREQSYSERQLYEMAFDRLVSEIAISMDKGTVEAATERVLEALSSQRK